MVYSVFEEQYSDFPWFWIVAEIQTLFHTQSTFLLVSETIFSFAVFLVAFSLIHFLPVFLLVHPPYSLDTC